LRVTNRQDKKDLGSWQYKFGELKGSRVPIPRLRWINGLSRGYRNITLRCSSNQARFMQLPQYKRGDRRHWDFNICHDLVLAGALRVSFRLHCSSAPGYPLKMKQGQFDCNPGIQSTKYPWISCFLFQIHGLNWRDV
jgi:hypothetical protein